VRAINAAGPPAPRGAGAAVVAPAPAVDDELLSLRRRSTAALELIAKRLGRIESLVEDYLVEEEEE